MRVWNERIFLKARCARRGYPSEQFNTSMMHQTSTTARSAATLSAAKLTATFAVAVMATGLRPSVGVRLAALAAPPSVCPPGFALAG